MFARQRMAEGYLFKEFVLYSAQYLSMTLTFSLGEVRKTKAHPGF